MVWFQCEDCGENLKKPKLPNHFRICTSYKLSCIDCGHVFDRHSVQSHTQCITEAEKYGPKGQAKPSNGTLAKPIKDKPKPDVDINVGLTDRPPWFCSLCNTKATSKQALLLHADGKKHRAKARGYAASQQPKTSEESAPTNKDDIEKTTKSVSPDEKTEDKANGHSNGVSKDDSCAAENGNMPSKKRKKDSNDDGSSEMAADEPGNGGVNESEVEETQKKKKKKKKAKGESDADDVEKKKTDCEAKQDLGAETASEKGGSENKIKWKKLISATLKSAPDGALKMKKLQKQVRKSLSESGIPFDDGELGAILEQKVKSSSKFTVNGKYVRLAA